MKKTKLKLTLLNIADEIHHHTIPFSINGKTGNLLIDTGASRTVFDSTRFSKFKHKGKVVMSPMASAGLGGLSNLQLTVIKKLSICKKINTKNYLVGIADLSSFNDLFTSFKNIEPIDGVLGYDFLRTYRANIDFGNDVMQLEFDQNKINKSNMDYVSKARKVMNL